MSPAPSQQASVVKRYYEGNHLDVQPVGGSPAIMHVATLRKLAPVWFDLSVRLKADRDADRIFGWVLEMWGDSSTAKVPPPLAAPQLAPYAPQGAP